VQIVLDDAAVYWAENAALPSVKRIVQ